MRAGPIPDDEAERLRVLDQYDVLDTEAEQIYDDLARLARYVTGASAGLVTILAEDRNWFKATVDLEVDEVERAVSFCSHLVDDPHEIMVVEDAREDERFADNPAVVGEPGVRFYAGRPLTTPEDHVIGSLCAIDTEPRSLDGEQRELLDALGRQVMVNLEARRRIQALDEQIDGLGRV